MKYLGLAILTVLLLLSLRGESADYALDVLTESSHLRLSANIIEPTARPSANPKKKYGELDSILNEISAQIHQPNVLKSDILRGWYLAGKGEKKYGTPDTWIFVEDGESSKWMSPNALEEERLIDDHQLCKHTAGSYLSSCLETSDSECEYIENSVCECLPGSRWKEDQGCILVTERGTYVSVNNAELGQGFYKGLPNEKKLNTPADWIWLEAGRESVWKKPL